ncbi:MAG TPA: GNAT family N-acetyltransferase [Xanthobacteraceae bacterium]|nr:GNAT family N-acetyltransferase [Xanthobacteraceae bacterium]
MNRSPDERSEIRGQPGGASPAYRSAHAGYAVRAYAPGDEEAAIALWLRTWQTAYPQLDFTARLDWWRARWRTELVPATKIIVAEADGGVAGFVTVDPATLYLDQIVVAPERWRTGIGAALIAEAKRLSPAGLDLDVNTDNIRAIKFYEKQGFSIGGAGVNPISGKPVHRMRWRP